MSTRANNTHNAVNVVILSRIAEKIGVGQNICKNINAEGHVCVRADSDVQPESV